MIEPISPSDVKKIIPDFVIEAVNQLIMEKWDGDKAIILQDDIMDMVSSNDPDNDKPSRREVFDKGWLDFEPLYRKKGWKVEYDKPGCYESYKARFIFKKNLNHFTEKKDGMLNTTNNVKMNFIKHILNFKKK